MDASRVQSGAGQEAEPFAALVLGAGRALRALEAFLESLPEAPAFALLFLLDSDQDREAVASLAAGLTTSLVLSGDPGMNLEAGRIYLLGPELELRGASLVAAPAPPETGPRRVQEILIRLGETCGSRGACILFDGESAPHARGLRAIQQNGGLILVQSSGSDRRPALPLSVLETELADLALPSEELPERLNSYILRRRKQEALAQQSPGGSATSFEEQALEEALARVQTRTGQDFRQYSADVIQERVLRRMLLAGDPDPAAYLRRLNEDDGEVRRLYREFLGGVTAFFRDAAAFEKLAETVIPELAQRGGEDTLRVWAPGCASGEEAYSLAILFSECLERQNINQEVQIFATDIDPGAIERARAGRYPESIAADVRPDRLEKYFRRDVEEGEYRVRPFLRELVIFSSHDLLRDPPFFRLDMISCRNLTASFRPDLQQKVLMLFFNSLRSGGRLFLGRNERVLDREGYFRALDVAAGIYARTDRQRGPLEFPLLKERVGGIRDRMGGFESLHSRGRRTVERMLLERYARPAVLVNERLHLLHVYGDATPYLALPEGEPTRDVTRMARGDLAELLREAIRACLQEEVSAEYEAPSRPGVHPGTRLVVRPADELDRRQVLVIFEHLAEQDEGASLSGRLERSSREARADSGARRRDELAAINDQLRHSNEELQSSREELQAMYQEMAATNSELQRKVRELQEANSDIENLLGATDVAVVFLDRAGQVRRFTPAATELFKLRPGDAGRPLTDIVSLLDYKELAADCGAVLENQTEQSREVRARDGSWYAARLFPYRRQGGEIGGVVLTFIDVTHLKNVAEEMRTARDAADAANRSKSEFLANMSHEIRTPLNSVLGSLQLVEYTDLSDEQTEYIQMALASGRALLTIVNDILDLSKIEAGRVDLRRESFHPAGLIQGVLDMFRLEALKKGLELGFELEGSAPRRLIGDAGRIRQILFNLIGNSLKFTERGRIFVSANFENENADRGRLHVSVRDTGAGISPEQQSSIFQPFTQLQQGRSRQGSGLGLSIVKKFVALMGGEISIQSEPGCGSTVYFDVRLGIETADAAFVPGEGDSAAAGEAADNVAGGRLSARDAGAAANNEGRHPATADHEAGAENRESSPRPRSRLAPDPRFAGKRILAAEDDPDSQLLLGHFLKKLGCECVIVSNGREALEALYEEGFDCVLMDMWMPEMDGVEATRKLRSSKTLDANIPVIAVTAHAMKEELDAFIEAGMDAYVTKPVNLQTLREALLKALTNAAD